MKPARARDKELTAQAEGRFAEVAELATAFEGVKAARVTLAKKPDDPDANLVVGQYLSFVKGDWVAGSRMLALGNDEALKALAETGSAGADGFVN